MHVRNSLAPGMKVVAYVACCAGKQTITSKTAGGRQMWPSATHELKLSALNGEAPLETGGVSEFLGAVERGKALEVEWCGR